MINISMMTGVLLHLRRLSLSIYLQPAIMIFAPLRAIRKHIAEPIVEISSSILASTVTIMPWPSSTILHGELILVIAPSKA